MAFFSDRIGDAVNPPPSVLTFDVLNERDFAIYIISTKYLFREAYDLIMDFIFDPYTDEW